MPEQMAFDTEVILGPALSLSSSEDFFGRPVVKFGFPIATARASVGGIRHDDGQSLDLLCSQAGQNQVVGDVERRASLLASGKTSSLIAPGADPGEVLATVLADDTVENGVLIYVTVLEDSMFLFKLHGHLILGEMNPRLRRRGCDA